MNNASQNAKRRDAMKHLTNKTDSGYPVLVTAKSVTGIGVPIAKADTTAFSFSAVFLCPVYGAAPFFGRRYAGSLRARRDLCLGTPTCITSAHFFLA